VGAAVSAAECGRDARTHDMHTLCQAIDLKRIKQLDGYRAAAVSNAPTSAK